MKWRIAGSAGCSENGGPWVKPADGMKKIVWSELRVKEDTINIKLTQHSGTTGPFQNTKNYPATTKPRGNDRRWKINVCVG